MAHGSLGPWFSISLLTELASELFGTFKRNSGNTIENTVVCLDDGVSFTWNTDGLQVSLF